MTPYLEALPALQAEQALDRIAQHAAGAGAMEEGASRRFVSDLRRTVNRARGATVQKATIASLSQLGIAVETVEPSEGGDGSG